MSEEVVSMELPAPPGWKKQYFPKRGGTPRKKEIVFTAPTGEEIHNQRQLQQYLKAHPDGPPASEFDWSTGETPRRSARISGKAKSVSPAESEPPKKRGRRSSASKKDTEETEAGADETETGEAEMKDAEKAEEEKMEHGDEKDAQMEEAEITEKEKTTGGDEKDAQEQETDGTKEKEPDSVNEVAKENQEENKDTSAETKDSVSLDAESEKDTSVPQVEGEKEVPQVEGEKEAKDINEMKTEGQPQVPADTEDVTHEQVKTDAEGGEKEPAKIDGGVIPSLVVGHETDPVQMEKPQDKEQPLSDAVKKDSLEEPMKLDVAVGAESNVHFTDGAKEDATDPGLIQEPKSGLIQEPKSGLIQEPKSEINAKPVEVAENGTQAGSV